MTEPLAVITGTLAHCNAIKTRSTFQLIVEIPIEQADMALERLGGWPQPGKEKAVAVALLKPNRTLAGGPDTFEKAKRKHASLAQLAADLCRDPQFFAFLVCNYPHIATYAEDCSKPDWAANVLREITGVDSRKEFDTDSRAAHRFIQVKEAFEQWSQP